MRAREIVIQNRIRRSSLFEQSAGCGHPKIRVLLTPAGVSLSARACARDGHRSSLVRAWRSRDYPPCLSAVSIRRVHRTAICRADRLHNNAIVDVANPAHESYGVLCGSAFEVAVGAAVERDDAV